MNTAADPGATDSPLVSVVIPTLNEESVLPGILSDLGRLGVAHEVIVSDGGSKDRTQSVAERSGARLIRGLPGRGSQLRAGAEAARAPLLAFLHADVRLPPDSLARLRAFAEKPPSRACVFRFAIESPRAVYRTLEIGTHLRAKWLSLPYGDQGLIVRATAYWRIGGHPPIPLMEDVALARSLRQTVGVEVLPERVLISPRRWERDGPLRRTARNLFLLTGYLLGANPALLARSYRPNSS